jgi:dTDP-4-dehydrorhamnose 3,5-epimerase
MIYHFTPLSGVYLIEPERREDDRGWFARTFCAREFAEMGMATDFPQCSTSYNARRGTVRGLHYQAVPCTEAKLVRCARGALFDVAVDIQPGSPTFGQWVSAELTAENGHMLYIPEGYAHGFQTLADGTEIFYQISTEYQPALSRGIRWNDPRIGIRWPLARAILSDRDRALPELTSLAAA